jgi:exonuclease III
MTNLNNSPLNLSVSSVNCNSLNMSTIGTSNHLLKVHGIVSIKSDIILLSDIRLCNSADVSNSHEVINSFRINPYCSYNFYSNSRRNKRGVGILLKQSIPFSVHAVYKDKDNNILGLQLELNGKLFGICAIYGPNHYCPTFFDDLRTCIRTVSQNTMILGGDWNCTYSCANDESNIDIINMRSPPNVRHSNLLKALCEEFELSDPYRIKNPNRRDFTYQPSAVGKNNRSRLDFFIVSDILIEKITKCWISPNLQNKMFDHKASYLSFVPPPKVIRPPTISRAILNDPDIDLVVKISIFETYVTDEARVHMLNSLGTARKNLKEAGPDPTLLPPGTLSDHEELVRSGTVANIKEILDGIPIMALSNGGFTGGIEDDLFMETLVNNIKNDCVSYQVFVNRTISNTVSSIEARLAALKSNYVVNCGEIFTLEKKINFITDAKLRAKLESNRNFEVFNNEKITPNFVNLSRGTKSEAMLSDLLDDSGNLFDNDTELKDYVRRFYKNLYKRPAADLNFNENCIQEFLGEDILNLRLVQDSIIPVQLANEFESALSLHELDVSAAEGNRSASGMDGLSNCLIKRYWDLLRIPLHRYANTCHRKGKLTQNFSSASIKLIPKKGDATKIKNWRPISLLSCLYKVISRALNNRLKKATGYIFYACTKGIYI